MLLSLVFMMFLMVCFLTERQLLFLWQILLPICGWCYCHLLIVILLADVIANDLWLMLLPKICGWCYCHMWLMLLPLIDCCYVGWCYCQCDGWCYCQCTMADVLTICGRWNGHFNVMGWCYCPVADGIATWLECGQMLFAQVVDGMTTESITLV